jgi:hypothetical protein
MAHLVMDPDLKKMMRRGRDNKPSKRLNGKRMKSRRSKQSLTLRLRQR